MSNKHFDIVYYCDSYPAIGIGHLKRGIDILHLLKKINSRLILALTGKYSDTAKYFIENFLKFDIPVLRETDEYSCRISIIDTMFIPGDADYIDDEFCNRLRLTSKKIIMINGGLNLKIPDSIDVLIDHIPDARISGNQSCKQYLGFDFAPANIKSFQRKSITEKSNILCVLGSNEVQSGLNHLVNALIMSDLNHLKYTIIVSPHFPQKIIDEIKNSDVDMVVQQNVKSLIPYFQNAFAVICTYGHTTYESLSFHIPTFVVAYRKFQYEYANYLEEKGLVENLGYLKNIDLEKLKLIISDNRKLELIEQSKFYFKTSGIENIANVILKELENV